MSPPSVDHSPSPMTDDSPTKPLTTTTDDNNNSIETNKNQDKKYITSSELLTHNKPDDLWISIQGKVYDVTAWSKIHPGGLTPLLNLAGQDVTDAFIAYHPGTAWHRLESLFTGYHLSDFQISPISKDYRKILNTLNRQGLFEEKGHGVIYNIITIIFMFTLVIRGVIYSTSPIIHFGCGFLLGLIWVIAAYLGHDSGHYVIMTNKQANRFTQVVTGNCLTGISIAWWKWTHNAHHLSVNSLNHDPDLQHIPVFAVSTRFFESLFSPFYGREMTFDRLARFLISYQHFTYYPIMIFGRFNLYLQTFLLLLSRRSIPDRALNLITIGIFWTWFPLLVSYLPNWPERIMFVFTSFTVTALQHIQFTLNHFSADTYVGKAGGNDWFEKQAGGTIDIDCSEYMDWAFGGLQFQLEHHLFPRLPRCHLRRVAPVVKDLCKKHGLPYRSFTYWQANVRTIQCLKKAAYEARDLTNLNPKNLVWEAVNTHG